VKKEKEDEGEAGDAGTIVPASAGKSIVTTP
jgi:hypothetical protein